MGRDGRDDRAARPMPPARGASDRAGPLPVARVGTVSGSLAARGNTPPAIPSVGVAARVAPAGAGAHKGFRTLLRNPHFLRLWLAQMVSQTINNAANYGMIVLIATQSGSVTATGGAIVAFSLPAALFGAPAGVLVDRFDKRLVLWVSNILRALATLGFVLTLFIDKHTLWPVYLLSFFIALVGQFFAPAEGAAIPLLVHEDELVNALALFNVTFTLAQAAGLIILGPLIITTLPNLLLGHYLNHALIFSSVQSLFVIVAILYVVCAALILTIPHARLVNRVERPHGQPFAEDGRLGGIWAGILECWRFVRHNRILLAAVLQLSLGGIVISVIAEIAPRFVEVFFNQPAALAAIVFVPAGLGLVLGSFAVPHLVKRLRRGGWVIPAGIITLAVCTALLTGVHWVARIVLPDRWWLSWGYIGLLVALMFLMGLALDLVNIPAQTVMQEQSPDWIKGRVLALQMMVFNAATVPVVFLVGIAADAFGLALAMNLLAVLIVVAGLAVVRFGVPAVPTGASPAVVAAQPAAPPPAAPADAPPIARHRAPVDPRAARHESLPTRRRHARPRRGTRPRDRVL